MEATPTDTIREGKLRVLWILLSGLVGAVGGLVLAEVICYSLIEISLVPAFAIVRLSFSETREGASVAFLLCCPDRQPHARRCLGLDSACLDLPWVGAFGCQCPAFPRRLPSCSSLWWFALLLLFFSSSLTAQVLGSGIACFFLQKDWFHNVSVGEKVPLYAALGMSFAFSLTFSFSELVAIAPCDRCCGTNLEANPVFGTPKQIFALFSTALTLGATFGPPPPRPRLLTLLGLLFGLEDVEDSGFHNDHFQMNAIISIPLGVGLGGVFGALNQFWRTQPQGYEEINEERRQRVDAQL